MLVILIPVLLLVRACSNRNDAVTPAPSTTATPGVASASATADLPAKQSSTPTSTPAPTATTAVKPTDCLTKDIVVTVTADAQTYLVGQPVTIAMRITNNGGTACKRDVGALVNEVYVTNVDGLVIWTSDACQKQAKPQVAVMKSKSVFGNTQIWAGSNSGQNCVPTAVDAMPGKYLIYARNDVVLSKPFAIEITDEPIETPQP